MPFLYLGAVLFGVILIAVVYILYCLVRNSSRIDKARSDKEQEEFLKRYKP